ncbi:MAG: methanol dehydrogenase [Novosphingobium sp. 12-64-8]|nr:MAG: methanol dehydrogenase [Novosphingobium sp. 12-64-8]
MRRILIALLAVLAFVAGPATAQTFPKLTGRVVDDAHLLNPQQAAALDGKLAALETQSQRQLVVVTVPSLEGYEIEDYGYRLGRAWGIGDKGRNDGALLIVAPTEHKVRIEVGYGLEGILTDALTSVIIQREVVPRFKANDYAGGITAATDQIVAQLQLPDDEARKVAEQAGAQQAKAGEPKFDFGTVVFLVIFFLFFVLPFIRSMRGGGRRFGGGPGVMIFPTGGWGGGGGGGGSDWGGGGGFSGGGGSFGGGGSSGSW